METGMYGCWCEPYFYPASSYCWGCQRIPVFCGRTQFYARSRPTGANANRDYVRPIPSPSYYPSKTRQSKPNSSSKGWQATESNRVKYKSKLYTTRRQATRADRVRCKIPEGYNLGHWDPDEVPFVILG